MKKALITGVAGLVGSAAARRFHIGEYEIVGIDNDMRRVFFGERGTTASMVQILSEELGSHFTHSDADIRDEHALQMIFEEHGPFDAIVHAAGQPSHDWSALHPDIDFDINACGTFHLLEAYRRLSPEGAFLFLSSNKVYGDTPNTLPTLEHETRFDLPTEHPLYSGVAETMSIDTSMHTIMGASKLAADIMTQEYGRTFGLSTGIFRAGCITGRAHRGVEAHGFLSYIARCAAQGELYRIFGYQGKQVRDIMHASDLANVLFLYAQKPRQGAVYNVGGTRAATLSVVEAIQAVGQYMKTTIRTHYIEEPRRGDHRWYVTDMRAFQLDFPEWKADFTLAQSIEDVCAGV